MATVQEALKTAFAHHQAGQLREADRLYRQVLAAEPNHADAWHLLGLLAHQVGQPDAAEQAITRAISLSGGRALFHANLGSVLRAKGNLETAEKALRRALELDPQQPDAYSNLGNVLLDRGDILAAEQAYLAAIRLRPNFAEAHNNLGTILHGRGDYDGAIDHYRKALSANPRYFDAYNNLGTALKAVDRLDDAADAYQSALRLVPQAGSAHLNMGTVHQAQGRLDEAARCYRECLRLQPDSALAFNNLGAVLEEQGDHSGAIDAYRRAIELKPGFADAHFNLGVAYEKQGDLELATKALKEAIRCDAKFTKPLMKLGLAAERFGRFDEALEYFERAIAADPRLASAHLHRASVHNSLGHKNEAFEGFQHALQLNPEMPEAYNHLAMMYSSRGCPDQAEDCCRRGLKHQPDSAALHANLATALSQQGRQVEAIAESRKAVELRPESFLEFSNLVYGLNYLPGYDPQRLFEEHLEWARRHAEPLTAAASPLSNDRSPNRRLRVGYVSPNFRAHAVNFFSEPLIVSHDHQQFEVFLYSDNLRNDHETKRLQAAADHWRETRYKSDAELAQLVRDDQIDILVDLTGHLASHRLLAFARRAAPVQVTYIGYQNTTGMSAMDYRLTDPRVDPPGETDPFYTETLYRLPNSYFCYRPADEVPEVTPLPADENGYVTFGSFNNFNKVTPEAIATWLRILERVPNSRLLVLASRDGYVQRNFELQAQELGIDPNRVEIANRLPRREYYELMQRADISLDPFPFNGHTTTCDSIWLGIPVVMLQGDVYASRFGSGVLSPLGLDRQITRSTGEYIDRAVELASDIDQLRALRTTLRARMQASVLLDFAGFARDVEAAYRQMWINYCNGAQRGEAK